MIYFRKHKIGKPKKRFSLVGNHFTIDLGFIIASGHNNGILIGFVSPDRNWYHVLIKYKRFKKRISV